MGFWNKLGKIALQAAPYVAAPFTGGASLSLAPMTKQLGQTWAQHDANKNAEKGLGPSKFDRGLDWASMGAGMAGGMGAFDKMGKGGGIRGDVNSVANRAGGGGGWQGKLSGMFGGGNGGGGIWERNPMGNDMPSQGGITGNMNQGGGWSGMLNNVMNRIGQGGSQGQGGMTPPYFPDQAAPRDPGMGGFAQRMRRQLGPIMGQQNQNNPNLAESIGAGRMSARMGRNRAYGY